MELNIKKFYSDCEQHQFASWFYWNSMEKPLGVVGLNPSITKGGKNATVSILLKLALREGFDSLFITNLYSYITPYPKLLKKVEVPVLDKNDDWIQRMTITCNKILCIWGNHPNQDRIETIVPIIKYKAYSIGFTKSGQPRHVLHTKSDVDLKKCY